MATVHSISVSPQRGQLKIEVLEAIFVENFGIQNDGHAGNWGRQVTLLSYQRVLETNQAYGLKAGPGDFAENVLIDGMDMSDIKAGSRLKLGNVILEVTQIGKEDHSSVVTKTLGVSLLPSEGLFCKVIKGGTVQKGDSAEKI